MQVFLSTWIYAHENKQQTHRESYKSDDFSPSIRKGSEACLEKFENAASSSSVDNSKSLKRKEPDENWTLSTGKSTKTTKRGTELSFAVDTMLVKTLSDMQKSSNDCKYTKELTEEDDTDTLFCKSLIPILRQLPAKKNRLERMKIQQTLYNLEFDESD